MKPPKPKPYNYRSMVRSAARKIWMWSPMRREAIRSARVAPATLECSTCDKRMKENAVEKEYQVDHIIPASEPAADIHSWDDFLVRLFVPAEGLTVLCKPCHALKTATENASRRPKSRKTKKTKTVSRRSVR